ncbi:hypothetical protein D3C74_356910 [compost metagenome]
MEVVPDWPFSADEAVGADPCAQPDNPMEHISRMPNPVLTVLRFPHLHVNLSILVVPPLNMCCTHLFRVTFYGNCSTKRKTYVNKVHFKIQIFSYQK